MRVSVLELFLRAFLVSAVSVLMFHADLVRASDPTGAKQSEAKLKVGFILPLSGEAASVGEAGRNGITLGLKKLTPKVRSQIEIFYEDDALIPVRSVAAFNKLVTVDDVDVIVNFSSGTGNAIAPLAERHKIPLLSVSSDPKISQEKKYVVNFWVTPDEEARVVFPEAKKRGYRKIARISTIQEGVFSVRDAFDRINDGSIQIVLDEEYPSDVKDFKPYLSKLRAKKEIDAIMMILLPGQLGVFAKQTREMGIDLPFFGFEIFEDSNEVKVSKNALVGSWYVNADDPDGSFISEYQKAFPEASLYSASNAHDAVLLLGKALEQGADREGVNTFLHTLKDFKGALGTYSASGDNRFTLPAALKVVTEGGFEKL